MSAPKPKLLKVGESITAEHCTSPASLPSIRILVITSIRKAPRWNLLTLGDGSKVEQLLHDGGLRRQKSNRFENLRPHAPADDEKIVQIDAANRVMSVLRKAERPLLNVPAGSLEMLAGLLEKA